MNLISLVGSYAIARFSPETSLPKNLLSGRGFVSVTRTRDELSVVCEADAVRTLSPDSVETGWHLLQVEGPLAFSMTGVLASLSVPLAEAGVSLFAISTFDTDYLLVREGSLEKALDALTGAGFTILR